MLAENIRQHSERRRGSAWVAPWPFGSLRDWHDRYPHVYREPDREPRIPRFRTTEIIPDKDDALEEEHPVYAAMLFPIIAISVGVGVELLISRLTPWLPYTPSLMVLGMLMGFASAYEPINVMHTLAYNLRSQ